jgi:hypothetical protein
MHCSSGKDNMHFNRGMRCPPALADLNLQTPRTCCAMQFCCAWSAGIAQADVSHTST